MCMLCSTLAASGSAAVNLFLDFAVHLVNFDRSCKDGLLVFSVCFRPQASGPLR